MVDLVSVVVPVYNRQDVVARAVSSLMAQRFHRPFEVIVVDDGSSDGSAAAAAAVSSDVRVLRQRNAGAAAARRTGIEAARGRFIAFLDSDDTAEEWHLEEHWRALHRRSDVVLSFARVTDMAGNMMGQAYTPQQLGIDAEGVMGDPLPIFIKEGCLTASMNLLTFREVALRAADSQYDVPAANDYSFALQAATTGPFAYSPRCTIRAERRDDGIGRTRRAQQFGFSLLAADAAVRASGRTDVAVMTPFRQRIGEAWPSAFVTAVRARHWRLASRLVALGVRHGLRRDSPKRLWWALGERNASR